MPYFTPPKIAGYYFYIDRAWICAYPLINLRQLRDGQNCGKYRPGNRNFVRSAETTMRAQIQQTWLDQKPHHAKFRSILEMIKIQ